MCLLCIQLEKEFSQFRSPDPKKNNDLATQYLKYLSLNPEQRCEFAKNFDYKLFNSSSDDFSLSGLTWDKILKESFKDIKEMQEIVQENERAMEAAATNTTITTESRPAICQHEWMIYYGAGTIKPEDICKKCGCPKSDNKASP